MAEIDPIQDDFIDGIIKDNQAGTPDPHRTSGEGMRQLFKKLRDRFEQEFSKITGWVNFTEIPATVTQQDLPLSYKGDQVTSVQKAIVYVQGQFYLSGSVGSSLTIGRIGIGYRPAKLIKQRTPFGSSDVYVIIQTNGEVKLQSVSGSNLVTSANEAYSINLFYKPLVSVPDENRLPIRSVMLTAFDEFGYDTQVQLATTEYGGGKALNAIYEQIKLRKLPTKTDFSWMMDEDMSLIPELNEAIMWINWFSPGMLNPSTVQPYIQETVKDSIAASAWMSGGKNADQVTVIPKDLKGSGSMNDMSFVRGALELQARGIKPGLVPVISTLNVNGNSSNYLNWRGYIVFDNESTYQQWAAEYENFIRYYIDLCVTHQINLGMIYVGSEFQCLLTADYRDSPVYLNNQSAIPDDLFRTKIKGLFINKLADIAAYAKSKFPNATITYAANWTEYNVLDDLWAKPAIDGVGIDWYFPLVEKHTNDEAALAGGIFSGEYADYYYTGYVSDDPNYKLSGTDGQGKTKLTEVPITGPGYLQRLKYILQYRDHLSSIGINKPFLATELGVASCNGSAVLPNVFPVLQASFDQNTAGNIAPTLPNTHNMKTFLQALSQFSYQVKDIIGPYGSTFEMDEEHQLTALKVISEELAKVNITKQVIYTLDARYSGMFGATIYNTETDQDEVYTSDTAIYPLNHTINSKKAGGYFGGDLLSRILPKASTGISIPESTASLSVGSFVNTDLYDLEWKQDVPAGFAVVEDDGITINSQKNAADNAGRFAYFTTLGQRTPVLVPVNGTLNFEAKGEGTIEVVIFSSSDPTSVQGRRTFNLKSDYRIFSWDITGLYPQLECTIGIFFNGPNTNGQASAVFKKNFALILDQADLSGLFKRYRADTINLMGNSETQWYGWNDGYVVKDTGGNVVKTIPEEARKKYLQSSAYSRFKFTTNADRLVIEYVRDFYNAYPKNVYVWSQVQSGKILSSNGAVVSGIGAVNTYTRVVPGQTYTISGLRTTQPEYVWMDVNENPISAKMSLSNVGTIEHPLYQVTAPTGAARLGLLIQRFLYPNNYKDPRNDKYTVYSNVMVEPGAVGAPVHTGPPDDNSTIQNVPTEYKTYMGTVASKVSGLSIFVTQNGTTTNQYLELEEGGDLAKKIQMISANLPSGEKTVEIVHNGRGTYLPADPNIRRAGTYMRAVYLPENSTDSLITTPRNPIVFVGDSIISGFNISSNPQKNVWIQKIARDPAYGYDGDVFSESYAGRILHTDTDTPEKLEAFAQKLARFKVNNVTPNFWFQIGVNDYGFITPIAEFTEEYPALIDRLHELLPDSKFYIQTIGPDFYEGPNAETRDPDDPDVVTGPTAERFREVQRSTAINRSYTELVEFKDLFPALINNLPDGIHPNDAGNELYAQGIKSKSNLLLSHPVNLVITQAQLPYFTLNNAYNLQLTTSGGAFPYTYTVTSGTLPAGVTLSPEGVLSGTPATLQTYSFTIQSRDSKGITVSKSFTGDVTDTLSGIPESTASLSIGTFINPDVYSEEWKINTPANYLNVTDNGSGIINADHSATGNAGRFAYFKVAGDNSGTSPAYINGKVIFEAKGTGTLEVVIFASYQDGIQARKTFTLTNDFQAFSMDISVYPTLECYCGIFFSGMNTVGPVSATFKKNFTIQLEQFGLSGNFKRLRADIATITGNVETAWYGRNYDYTKVAYKYLQASPYSFMRFTTNATTLLLEYVRDFYNGPNNNISGLTIFYTISGVTTDMYIDLEAITPIQYNITVNQVSVTLPAGSKKVEVVMPGHTAYPNFSPHERLGGTFLRAIYFPAGSDLMFTNTAHPDSVCFLGDSIISGYTVSINSQKNVWIHQIHRYPIYNYPGDVFSESYGGRYLYFDIKTDALMNAFVTKIAQFQVNKYWIQLAVNDYYKVGSSDEPGVTLNMYKTRYGLFLDALHAAKPSARVYLQTIGPIRDEVSNGPSGNNVAAFRNAVKDIGASRTSFCEVVDFENIFDHTDPVYLPDGLHPADPGQNAYAQGIQSRSTLLTSSVLTISPTTLGTISQGLPFSLQLTTMGGVGNKTFTYTGNLPNNTTLVNGLISGTPNSTTAYDFTLTATDEANQTATVHYTGNVTAVNITIMPASMSDIMRGSQVNQQLSASGGASPYTFAIDTGSALPAGLNLSNSGLITGTPTVAGATSVVVKATDSLGNNGKKNITFNIIAPAISITPTSLTPVTTGNAIGQQLSATGGVGSNYTFLKTAGNLPAGVTLNSNGTFNGNVTSPSGTYSFTVTVTDAGSNTGTRSYDLSVTAVNIVISPSAISNKAVNNPVTQQLGATGGIGSYTFSIISGELPAGLALSSSGLISGTPTSTETKVLTIAATDANSNVGTKEYTITIINLSKIMVLSGSLTGNTLTVTATLSRAFPDTIYMFTNIYLTDGVTYVGGKQLVIPPGQTSSSGTVNVNVPAGTTSLSFTGTSIFPSTSDGVDITFDTNQTVTI
jgi:lysophospholipase L1-like esterase